MGYQNNKADNQRIKKQNQFRAMIIISQWYQLQFLTFGLSYFFFILSLWLFLCRAGLLTFLTPLTCSNKTFNYSTILGDKVQPKVGDACPDNEEEFPIAKCFIFKSYTRDNKERVTSLPFISESPNFYLSAHISIYQLSITVQKLIT